MRQRLTLRSHGQVIVAPPLVTTGRARGFAALTLLIARPAPDTAAPKAARGARGACGAAGSALPPLLHMGLYPLREAPRAARARATAPAARA